MTVKHHPAAFVYVHQKGRTLRVAVQDRNGNAIAKDKITSSDVLRRVAPNVRGASLVTDGNSCVDDSETLHNMKVSHFLVSGKDPKGPEKDGLAKRNFVVEKIKALGKKLKNVPKSTCSFCGDCSSLVNTISCGICGIKRSESDGGIVKEREKFLETLTSRQKLGGGAVGALAVGALAWASTCAASIQFMAEYCPEGLYGTASDIMSSFMYNAM